METLPQFLFNVLISCRIEKDSASMLQVETVDIIAILVKITEENGSSSAHRAGIRFAECLLKDGGAAYDYAATIV